MSSKTKKNTDGAQAPCCRFCNAPLTISFADLGAQPPCNYFLPPEKLNAPELFLTLHAYVCDQCWLVQVEAMQRPDELFTDYHYFSSFSDTWLAHCERYTKKMIERFNLDGNMRVVEIASNDGYLLQYFQKAGIEVLGIEPAANVAEVANKKGITTRSVFFGEDTAKSLRKEGLTADMMAANNVLAHVPDINDFVEGFRVLLNPKGVATFEFPHLLQLIRHNQFDTIYHEHFSYLSLLAVTKIFAAHGLRIFDVEELSTHGGSLRLYVCHDKAPYETEKSVGNLLDIERQAGMDQKEIYEGFAEKVRATKRKLLAVLIDLKNQGKQIVGYGAPGKGTVLLNYCGIGPDFMDYTVDRSPAKQDHFMPGVRVPIFGPDKIRETKPDYVLILPWNIQDEVMTQMRDVRDWGGQFIIPIPEVTIR